MYSYSYMPMRDLKKCSFLPFVSSVCGFGLMVMSRILPFPFVFQTIGIALIALAIFTTTRYLVRRYAYSVQKAGEGDYDFVVNEISGKNSRVVCRINMDEISDFVYSADGKVPEKYEGKRGKDILRFDYCQDIRPIDAYYLYASLREGKVCVKFSPDKKMADIIEKLMPREYDFEKKTE